MTARRAWARAGLVVVAVLVLDQLTKALIRSDVALGQENDVFVGVKLVHVANRGVAFSQLSGHAGIVAAIIAAAVGGLLVYFARHTTRPLMWLPVGMLAGGAVGNVVDRIARGEVTDFVKLPAWPAFNVADMAITFGVIGLVLLADRKDATEEAAA